MAHSAASSDPVPPNSSGCERPLEALFRLPYAIALTSAIALFGFGALYWVSIPLSSGSPLIGSEQNLSPLDREALALADSEFAKVLMTSDDSWFAYDTERSRYVEIKGLKLDVKPRELSEANVLNGIEWVGDVSGTYRVQRVLSISGVQLEWDEWTGAGSLSVVHCEKVRGRWHTEASDLKRLSVLRRHSVFASAKDVTVAEALASLLPKKLGDKLRADIEKLRADIETVRQAKIANLLEQARRWLTSEQELPGIYESVLKLNSQYDSARSDYQSVLKLDSNNAAAKAGLLEADKAEAEFVKRGVEISRKIRAATKEVPWVNSLGMMFVPVPIAGRPADGVKVLFSVWNLSLIHI